jgi:DNA (cytosine-5)-methyltransferase 1
LGTRTSQNAQVGNAVPPLLAFKIAKALIKLIKWDK